MGVKTFTHSSPSHSQDMLGKLNSLRNEGHFCDVTIRVQDKIFRAHKVVLAACSDFFRSKLVGQTEEKCVLDLHHVTVTGFTPLLEYAYTATLSINTENIIDVLAAASYMQMFNVASTCSEFMKSSILWNTANNQQERPPETTQENTANCNFPAQDGSLSPVSSECSVVERAIPVCRESRRKRKNYLVMSPESLLKCSTQAASTQILNPSTSYTEARSQPVDSSLAFQWTFPFGVDRRLQSEKPKQVESSRTLELPGPSDAARRETEFVACESSKATLPLGIEDDIRVKVERLSDEEVHEEVSQPVSASQSSLSDQQTVPGSEQVQEDLLISPQSSSIGSIDEGVTEGLPTLQGTSSASAHADDDDRLESAQYPYQLYITPTTSNTERPSPNCPDRPFQCPTCGVRFTRIQNLKQHMLIHSGIKPFQCDRCGKKFTRAYSLKMHRLKHEGKRCFRCQICSATFTSFGEYKHHMRVSRHIIRKPRIYECKTCGAMFTNSGNLIVHLRSLNHEASELANYFQSSDFLVPDYLNHEQEETLGQYELGEHSFENGSSVQMPVISQVSSTQNCESTFPLGTLGTLVTKDEETPEQPKTSDSPEGTEDEPQKKELAAFTIE
ncbi:zinc finger and BTB domain-containing protein 44 [Latimeria chalumnae]|uniref:Zinc finger and BTB domain-containing protein 44 n=1 Tax=Latimeria chalumnae TaxID=7897 RepID=H3B298_LATCH|nr:PREDICTED: zinc finger and BTB domain-containing protein 44 [Latimeria chalumnae]XP_005999979.1 PREDICTED: zinc finger and BTB domain-containing protein 44 [Latimeria chalumnae]XP_014346209.1 PREDICTED: zinc finger and BTB domain-containing protein 44 [Latimeria chalumnae]|eukprot:XP_005999978.1 PREDICTED: zinc finger and BTB domain-containing protein 44 [Latimeria chalumnae]